MTIDSPDEAGAMLAAVAHSQGANDLRIERLPVPEPGPGQVLIRVEAAGVNFSDVKRRRGDAYPFATSFPFVPGGEVAGTVVRHGPGVDGPPPGTPVFALAGENGSGGYAQYALSHAATAVPIPDGVSFDRASTLLIAGCTARLLLGPVTRLQPGESVLVPAATGGVGSFALQVARQAGAGRVIAAVGRADKAAAARGLGADDVVVATDPGWTEAVLRLTDGRGVDVALEASGGTGLAETLRCLAPFGRLAVFGAASGKRAVLDAATLDAWLYAPAPNQSVTAFNVGDWFLLRPRDAGAALAALVGDVASGRIATPRLTALPLAEAHRAHDLLETRRTSGKLVLRPWA